jgi:hypothetical protein
VTAPAFTAPAAPDPTMRWGDPVHAVPLDAVPVLWARHRSRAAGLPARHLPGVRIATVQHRCIICLVGIMPNWSGWRRGCGYTGCHEQAVAKAPRVGWVCAEHLDHPKRWWGGKQISVAEDIAHRLAIRDGREPGGPPINVSC